MPPFRAVVTIEIGSDKGDGARNEASSSSSHLVERRASGERLAIGLTMLATFATCAPAVSRYR